ncbi:hypothetical protein [Methylothermus subterraneus]
MRWHVLGMGKEVDLHTAHWHGEMVLLGGLPLARLFGTRPTPSPCCQPPPPR